MAWAGHREPLWGIYRRAAARPPLPGRRRRLCRPRGSPRRRRARRSWPPARDAGCGSRSMSPRAPQVPHSRVLHRQWLCPRPAADGLGGQLDLLAKQPDPWRICCERRAGLVLAVPVQLTAPETARELRDRYRPPGVGDAHAPRLGKNAMTWLASLRFVRPKGHPQARRLISEYDVADGERPQGWSIIRSQGLPGDGRCQLEARQHPALPLRR